MKAKEIMVGDWVYNAHNRKPEQVQEIGSGLVMLDYNDLYEYDEIEPIPLTAEIMLNNEFKKFRFLKDYYCIDGNKCLYTDCKEFGIWTRNIAGDWEWFAIGECKYVHQLQHILKDCEIEKEIEL